MRFNNFLVIAASLAALAVASPAGAASVNLQFSGSVLVWTGAAYAPFSSGAPVTGRVIYDTSTAFHSGSVGADYYDAVLPGSGFNVDGISLGFGPSTFVDVQDDDGFGHDVVTIVDPSTPTSPTVNGLGLRSLYLTFFDPIGTALSSDALPAASALVTDFSQVSVYAFYGPGSDNFLVASASRVSVPEPGTWALLLTGLAGLGAMIRRRNGVAEESGCRTHQGLADSPSRI